MVFTDCCIVSSLRVRTDPPTCWGSSQRIKEQEDSSQEPRQSTTDGNFYGRIPNRPPFLRGKNAENRGAPQGEEQGGCNNAIERNTRILELVQAKLAARWSSDVTLGSREAPFSSLWALTVFCHLALVIRPSTNRVGISCIRRGSGCSAWRGIRWRRI
jgi:hypothetical protein